MIDHDDDDDRYQGPFEGMPDEPVIDIHTVREKLEAGAKTPRTHLIRDMSVWSKAASAELHVLDNVLEHMCNASEALDAEPDQESKNRLYTEMRRVNDRLFMVSRLLTRLTSEYPGAAGEIRQHEDKGLN